MASLDQLVTWHTDAWKGLRVTILGAGVSGFAAADTLVELGADVTVIDRNPDEQRATLLGVIGAKLVVPEHDEVPEEIAASELIIASPGLPPHHPWLRRASESGIPVWGDIELAWRLRDKVHPADWIVVTGTNGKTTTVQLAAHMLLQAGYKVAPVGNIGTAVLDAIRDPQGFEVLVVELSSFQLHTLGEISPHSAAVLNIADDHIDWHGSAEAYATAKAKIYHQVQVAAVYNLSDSATERMVAEADVVEGARAIGFGTGVPGPSNFGIVDDVLVDRAFLDDRRNSALELATFDDLAAGGLKSPHMAQNALAAAALARAYGASPEAIRDAIRSFSPDAHRTQFVGVVGGVTYIDDSKATNPHAAAGSLSAFTDVVWLVGGLLKGVDVAPLVERVARNLRAAVVLGADRSAVLDALQRHAPEVPVREVTEVETELIMRSAVELAAELAEAGDTVLLAPAAASWDQFASYGDRGDRFQEAVRSLAAREGDIDGREDLDPGSGA